MLIYHGYQFKSHPTRILNIKDAFYMVLETRIIIHIYLVPGKTFPSVDNFKIIKNIKSYSFFNLIFL
jgi:hypothetical protein